MIRRRAAFRVAAVAAIGALALAACGSSSGGGKASPSGSAPASSSGLVPTNIVRPSTVKGGTLNFGFSDDFDSLDGARAYYAVTWNFMRAFYLRTPLAFASAPGPAELTGDLATGPAVGEQNNTLWTYHLKSGITFEDGTPITSQDIKYAVERTFATDVISGGPMYFLCILTKCDATGASPYPGPYKDTKGLDSIETPNASTITFKLVKPFADFNYLMQLPGAAPVPAAKDTRDKYAQHPVSSGPYKIQSYNPGKSLVLVRNTAWDPATDTIRKALPDRIVVTEGLDAQDEDNRVLAGTLDLETEQIGAQVPTQSKILRDKALEASESLNSVTGFLRYVTIQTKVAPFDNVNCRIAVQYAIDKTSLQTARGGPVTGGAIATTLFPPTLAGYHKFDLYPDGPGNHGDLAKARQYLAKCGKPNGFSTVMAYQNKGKGPKDALAVQQALARVGIKVSLDGRNSSTYYSNDIGTPSNVKAKDYGLADAGWGPDYPAPYGFVESIVDGRAIKQSGNSNYSELNDPRVNGAIDASLAADGQQASVAAISKVDDYVMQDANIVPFVYDKALNIFSKRLTNVYILQGYGQFDFASLGVGG